MQQQNVNVQNQPGIMEQPPGIISTKDSLYMTDMMSWNLLAAKKAHFFASQCQDQELKAEAERCGQMHQRHYQQLLGHINEHVNQQQQPLNNLQ